MKYELSFLPGHSRRELREKGSNGQKVKYMRYALCLSGFMRTFRQSIRQLRTSLLDRLPCDIFISTWDVVGRSHYKHSTGKEHDEKVFPEVLQSVYGGLLRGFSIKHFDPMAITPQWLKDIPAPPNDARLFRRLSSMYYHIWEANRLKNDHSSRNGFTYDVTIRCRPDIFFTSKLWEILPSMQYAGKKVFTPKIEAYKFVNDQFMFGNSHTMNIVADLYQHIKTKSPAIPYDPPLCPLCPAEKLLLHYLNHHQIEINTQSIEYVRG